MTLRSKNLAKPSPKSIIGGNYFDKYRSRNPIHKALVGGFLRCGRELLADAKGVGMLEVGCGAGDLAFHLLGSVEAVEKQGLEYIGTDVCEREILRAREQYPGRAFETADIYDLPFSAQSFDLVVACEVLEHLERPADALRELARVGKSHFLFSVPWEPVWRVLNVCRGKYLFRLGNTPGHVQHFSRRAFRRLVSRQFEIVAERRPFPWTMLLAKR